MEILPKPYKRFLRDILSITGIPHKPVRQRQHKSLMFLHDRTKCTNITGYRLLY
jgi:hypothetical protein